MKSHRIILTALLSTALIQPLHAGVDDDGNVDDKDASFEYYLAEFTTFEQDRADPMARLIIDGLSTALFDCRDEVTFRKRMNEIRSAYEEHPDKAERFLALDKRLQGYFDEMVKASKQKRMIYTTVGALIGAVVAIPVGLWIDGKFMQLGAKVLFITIPAGAMAGMGVGFLLGNLLAMPKYQYQPGQLSKDLEDAIDQVSEMH